LRKSNRYDVFDERTPREPIEKLTPRRQVVVVRKKHNSIAYHRTREAVAAGTIRVTKEDGKTNLADVVTKLLHQATKDFFCNRFMY
jgi:hypothetical protein